MTQQSRPATARPHLTAVALPVAIVGDAVTYTVEPAQLFDDDVNDLARVLAFTFRRKTSILVRVHSVLRERWWVGDVSVRDQDRMDNLLKVHI